MRDLDIIAAVDELARSYVNADDERLGTLPSGYECHKHRWRWVRKHWEQAVKDYKKQTGQDVLEALARHEKWLRSPENAPQLYVDRR